jgi:hypothetical protein
MRLGLIVACCIAAVALAAPAGIAAGKRSRTKVVCINGSLHREYKVKPKRCTFHKRGEPMAEAFFVRTRHDHWRRWGRARARGRGRDVAPMGHSRPPVKIKLSHPVHRCGHRVFAKARFYFPRVGRATSMRIDTCARR